MIGLRGWQAANLTDARSGVSFITYGRNIGRREQRGVLKQAAEFFLADADVNALFGITRGRGFIFDFEPFKSDDAEKFCTDFPDLGLAEFEGRGHTKLVRPEAIMKNEFGLS